MFESLDISASALLAQRTRMDAIAGNIANMNTTRNARGEPIPYRRRFAVFAAGRPDGEGRAGVSVAKIEVDKGPFRKEYQPSHPDANKDGYVSYPNIDLAVEYVNALEASRAYEANVTAMEVSKAMMNASLRLLA
jgi:flagellar basal-body rod protein FlgC